MRTFLTYDQRQKLVAARLEARRIKNRKWWCDNRTDPLERESWNERARARRAVRKKGAV